MAKNTVSTSHYKIFDYWKDKCITENGDVMIEYGYDGCNREELNKVNTIPVVCDWGEPQCWGCDCNIYVENNPNYLNWLETDDGLKKIYGCKEFTSKVERAHIIPNALGGSTDPDNLFLLCPRCHAESPDINNKKLFFQWIYKRRRLGGYAYQNINKANDILRKDYNIKIPIIDENDFKLGKTFNSHGAKISDDTMVYSYINSALKNKTQLKESHEIMYMQFLNEEIKKLESLKQITTEEQSRLDTLRQCLNSYEMFKSIEMIA